MEVKLFDGFESYLEQIHAVEEENLTDKVRKILKQVRVQGDSALLELTQHFDGVRLEQLRVSPKDLKNAFPAVDPELRGVLEQAAKNIRDFHQRQKTESQLEYSPDGSLLGWKVTPLDRLVFTFPVGARPIHRPC